MKTNEGKKSRISNTVGRLELRLGILWLGVFLLRRSRFVSRLSVTSRSGLVVHGACATGAVACIQGVKDLSGMEVLHGLGIRVDVFLIGKVCKHIVQILTRTAADELRLTATEARRAEERSFHALRSRRGRAWEESWRSGVCRGVGEEGR